MGMAIDLDVRELVYEFDDGYQGRVLGYMRSSPISRDELVAEARHAYWDEYGDDGEYGEGPPDWNEATFEEGRFYRMEDCGNGYVFERTCSGDREARRFWSLWL